MPNTDMALPPTADALRESVAALLETDPAAIGDGDDLVQLGLDSLLMMRLVNQWRRRGIRVSSRALAAEPTLEAWTRHLEGLWTSMLTEADHS